VPLFEQDGLRPTELAAMAHLSKQAVTGLVARCESDGLVERQRDPTDRRAFVVRLSGRGRRFRAVAETVLGEVDEELRELLGTRNRDALTKALKGVMEL
jgi:DNA-binding MarR family transcriptional regulator